MKSEPNSGVVSPSVIIFAFLFALVGLILGIVTLSSGSKDQKGHGIAITAISAIMMLLGFLVQCSTTLRSTKLL